MGNWKGDPENEWLLTATSQIWDYNSLFNDPAGGSHIASQLAHPTANPWTPDAYSAPEPSSGLMLLFGGLLLALRRRKNIVPEEA